MSGAKKYENKNCTKKLDPSHPKANIKAKRQSMKSFSLFCDNMILLLQNELSNIKIGQKFVEIS